MKICIDAGHYGKYNRSPVVPNYYESDMTWKLHLMQKEILERYGFEVILTRSEQGTDMDVYKRGFAGKGCDLFLSDHSNACANATVNYPVVYRAYDNKDNADELALQLAKVIAATMGTTSAGRTATRRGASGNEYYGVLRGARAAGLSNYYIIEHSFHTNKKMTQWLQKEDNLRKLAEAECRVIAAYYGKMVDKEEDGTAVEPKPEVPEEGTGEPTGTYTITTTCDVLNIRKGAGTRYPVTGSINEKVGEKKRYTIVEEQDGWGKLKSELGWINLAYTQKNGTGGSIQEFESYTVMTTCDVLNIRKGAGTEHPITGSINEKEGSKKRYNIVEEQDGWGRLKSGAGWINLSYTERTT